MTQQHALGILIEAVRAAYKRGAYEMEEVQPLLEAITVFLEAQDEANRILRAQEDARKSQKKGTDEK